MKEVVVIFHGQGVRPSDNMSQLALKLAHLWLVDSIPVSHFGHWTEMDGDLDHNMSQV